MPPGSSPRFRSGRETSGRFASGSCEQRCDRVIEEIVQTAGARSACLYLVNDGRAVLAAQRGDTEAAALLQREIARIAEAVPGEVHESEIASVLARIPTELRGSRKVMPLVATSMA